MLPFAYYILKVTICSGILYGYYLGALKNKIFHRWNRFYLLAAIVLSLIAPLIKINIWQNANASQPQVIHLIQAVNTGDEFVYEFSRQNQNFHLDANYISAFFYMIISLFLLVFLIQTLIKINRLKQQYACTVIDGINFINTDAKGTPFSFFKNIFWNNKIDLNSSAGNLIFKHEVAHVREKHSYDKIFINLILILFWCNPIFWIIKKELTMIHEFIADNKAVEHSDTAAFAAMILQATYPQQNFSITNNFFYSPLKRRLLMLTKNNNPKISYLSRLLVLPMAALVFFAFTLRVRDASLLNDKLLKSKDTIPNKKSAIMIKDMLIEQIPNLNSSSNQIQKSENDMIMKNVVIEGDFELQSDVVILKDKNKKPLNFDGNYLIINNGKEFNKEDILDKLKNKLIKAKELKVYPPNNEEAIKLYGNAAKDGVMAFTDAVISSKPFQNNKLEITDIQLTGTKTNSTFALKNNSKNNDIIIKNIQLMKVRDERIDSAIESFDTIPKNLKIDKIFTKVEVESSFPGGEKAWTTYITKVMNDNINEILKDNKSGTCRVKFLVDKDGTVSDVTALLMQGTKLAEVSVNAIKKGPKWIPAMQNNHIVAAYREQPITFTISEN